MFERSEWNDNRGIGITKIKGAGSGRPKCRVCFKQIMAGQSMVRLSVGHGTYRSFHPKCAVKFAKEVMRIAEAPNDPRS